MRRLAVVEKDIGETPLMALEKYRARESLGDVPITYAGRLDPMAGGKLLLLIGDECKRRSRYDALEKEYEFEVLFGVESDTGDILGLISADDRAADITESALRTTAKNLCGPITLPYPAYSSKTVDGKPLFVHARERGVHAVSTPQRAVRIHSLALRGVRIISGADIVESVTERMALLRVDEADPNPYKDFRRDEVVARWRERIEPSDSYTIARFSAIVSSGTYIRSLAPLIGELLGTHSIAFSIHRTKIGRYVGLLGRGFWAAAYE